MHNATCPANLRTRKQRPRFFTPLRFETLEDRTLLADVSAASASSAWHNVFDPLDVNADSFVAPNDVVQIINYVNANGAGAVPPGGGNGPPFYDTDGNAFVGAADALAVINGLNAFGASAARLPPDARNFAFVAVNGTQRTQILVISNTGTTPIHLSPLQISGPGAADYSLVQAPSSVIAAGSTTSVTVKFDPSAIGARPATVSIPNDSVLSNYNFAINGVGVDVQGLAAAAPGTIETVTVQGVSLNTTAETSVVLTDPAGHEEQLVATPVTASSGSSSFTFPVPPFIDLSTFTASAGTLNIRLEQQAVGGVTRVEAGSLAVSGLPQTGVAAGAVISQHITQMINLIAVDLQRYQAIQTASGGAVHAGALLADLQAQQQQFGQLRDLLQPLISGQVQRVDLGKIGGIDVFLDSTSLQLLDQTYVACLLNPAAGSVSALQSGRPGLPGSTAIEGPASFDPVQSVADQFANLLQNKIPQGIYDFAGRYKNGAKIGIGLTALGAIALGAPVATTLAAGALMGAMVTGISTWVPAAVGGVSEGSSNFIYDVSGQKADFDNTWAFFEKSTLGLVTDKAIDAVANQIGGTGSGPLIAEMIKTSRRIYSSSGATSTEISQNFSPTHDVLFPPTASISDVSKAEGNSGTTVFAFNVSLSFSSAATVTIDYATADGTATTIGDADYGGHVGSLMFAPGQTSQSVTISVFGDTKVEPDETFFVNLFHPTNVIIGRSQAVGTIVNDDQPPSVLGTWSGPYTFTVPAGPCITHNQGTARITFTSLGANGALSGTSFVDGVDDLNFSTCAHVDYSTASGSSAGTLAMDKITNGLLDMTNDRFGGNVQIKFTATITGNTMTGKLFDANGVQRGSFTLTKQ